MPRNASGGTSSPVSLTTRSSAGWGGGAAASIDWSARAGIGTAAASSEQGDQRSGRCAHQQVFSANRMTLIWLRDHAPTTLFPLPPPSSPRVA
jgi:hypothetical protein